MTKSETIELLRALADGLELGSMTLDGAASSERGGNRSCVQVIYRFVRVESESEEPRS